MPEIRVYGDDRFGGYSSMDDSILNTVKKMLGLEADYTAFDTDIIVFINSALMVLNQLGVGKSLRITGFTETWASFLDGQENLSSVKDLVYLRVRRVFDPPSSSSVIGSIDSQISELEWRLNVFSDPV